MISSELIRKILKYPLVEYITLRFELLKSAQDKPGRILDLNLILTQSELDRLLQVYAPDLIRQLPVKWGRELILFSVGYALKDLKYRTNTIVVLGEVTPGWSYLYRLNVERLYRDKVYFLAYDQDGERLQMSSRVYQVPKSAGSFSAHKNKREIIQP